MKTRSVLAGLLLILTASGCDDFGTRLEFNGGELFYTDAVTTAEANLLGNYLVDNGFFDGGGKTVQLAKTGTTFEFRMVVKKGLEEDAEYVELAKTFAEELSQNVFGGAQTDVHLCDENLQTLKVAIAL